MKKGIALILSLAMILVVLTGCGAGGSKAGESVKTGLAVITSIGKSADAGEKDGLAQADSTVVAVMVDKDGKIVNCKIDAVQTKINFTKEGKITTPLDTIVKSKQELKTDYGMIKASGIKKEWNEQADAFAAYVVGKTVDQVKGMALNEEGAPAEKELETSVTMHVTDYIAAIEKAVANAQDLGAKSGDKLGLGILTTIAKSTDATAEKEGLAQAYSSYTATTFGADGKITSCYIDASQTNINFSVDGKITTDLATAFETKNELGPKYGMAKASGIKKEWNEQAAALAQYVTGKTVDQVKGISLNEEGAPADKELTSSVTIHITDYITIIEKASANAK